MSLLRRPRYRYRTVFYYRLMISFTLVSIVIVLLTSTVSYHLFLNQFSAEVAQNHRRVMEYNGQTLSETLFENGGRLFSEVSMNQPYAQMYPFFLQNPRANNSVMVLKIYESLSTMNRLSANLLSSVMVYYPGQGFFISSTMGYKVLNDKSNAVYQEMVDAFPPLNVGRVSWWQYAGGTAVPGAARKGIVFGGIPSWGSGAGSQRAHMYFFVNPDLILGLLNSIAAQDTTAYLLDENGRVLAASRNAPQDFKVPEEIWQPVSESAEPYQSVTDTKSPDRELYTFSLIPGSQWRLALSMPMASYTRSSHAIMLSVIIAMAACLAVFLPLTTYISRRLYTPIQQLAALARQLSDSPEGSFSKNEYDAIGASIQRLSLRLNQAERTLYINRPILRHVQLQHLLSSGGHALKAITKESLDTAEIFFGHPHFAVVLCEWLKSDETPDPQMQALCFLLIAHVEGLLGGGAVRVYGYAAESTRAAFIVNAAQAESEKAMQIVDAARTFLDRHGVESLCAVGEWFSAMEAIHTSYKQACALMEGRFFAPSKTDVLIKPAEGEAPTYALEERYAACLGAGNAPDAAACLRQLCAVWQSQAPALAHQSLRHIGNITMLKCPEHAKRSGLFGTRLLIDPTQVLFKAEAYPDAMQSLLIELMQTGPDQKNDLVERTNQYILTHLSSDLSLESIAEDMHFSPKYFSRLFKELSGVGINAHINALRLERAAHLLRTTHMRVEDIAQQTGYRSTQYFIRKFRETYGVTPRQYQQEQAAR